MSIVLIRIIVIVAVILLLGRKFQKFFQQTLKKPDQQKDQDFENYFGGVIIALIQILVLIVGLSSFGEGALFPIVMIGVLCTPFFSEIMGWEYLHNTPFFLGGMTVLIIFVLVIVMIETDRCGFC